MSEKNEAPALQRRITMRQYDMTCVISGAEGRKSRRMSCEDKEIEVSGRARERWALPFYLYFRILCPSHPSLIRRGRLYGNAEKTAVSYIGDSVREGIMGDCLF